jgi:putative transposase
MRKPYPSDLTDEQWAILAPLIPVNTDGRPRVVDMREVVNAILYLDRAGCQWDMLPHDLPAKSTVYDHFARWRDDGTWGAIQEALRRNVREAAGRDPAPKVGCIDSQTVKGAEVGGSRGDDGGKKLRGRKPHIVVDSLGLLLVVLVTAANLDDGTHARHVLARLTAEQCARLEAVRGDAKYRNRALDAWLADGREVGSYVVEVVARPPGSVGFVHVEKRWVVERTFAWIGRSRRNSRDYERLESSSEAMIMAGSIHRMLWLRPDSCDPTAPFKDRENQGLITG